MAESKGLTVIGITLNCDVYHQSAAMSKAVLPRLYSGVFRVAMCLAVDPHRSE